MSDHAPVPGWYPDPYGARGQLRWWDGGRWTPAVRAPSPGTAAIPAAPGDQGPGRPKGSWAPPSGSPGDATPGSQAPPGAAFSHQAGPGAYAYPGHPGPYAAHHAVWDSPSWRQPRQRPVWPWLATGGGVLVLAVVVVLLLAIRAPGLDGLGEGNGTPHSPVVGRVHDKASGLSYVELGGDWRAMGAPRLRSIGWSAGMYLIAQRDYNGNGADYLATILSRPLPARVPYQGPSDLENASGRLATLLESGFYPSHDTDETASKATTIDGHAAWIRRFGFSYPESERRGWAFSHESMTVLLIDRGRRAPAVLWCSIPDNYHQLVPDVDAVIASTEVDGGPGVPRALTASHPPAAT